MTSDPLTMAIEDILAAKKVMGNAGLKPNRIHIGHQIVEAMGDELPYMVASFRANGLDVKLFDECGDEIDTEIRCRDCGVDFLTTEGLWSHCCVIENPHD